jgi:hypothetical protein
VIDAAALLVNKKRLTARAVRRFETIDDQLQSIILPDRHGRAL